MDKIGGFGSQYMGDFYAQTAVGGPRAISYATLKYIDNSPMFNPLATDTVFPTTSTGIIPTGIYLANAPNEKVKSEMHGGSRKLLETVSQEKLLHLANKYNVSSEYLERDQLISAIREAKLQKKLKKNEKKVKKLKKKLMKKNSSENSELTEEHIL